MRRLLIRIALVAGLLMALPVFAIDTPSIAGIRNDAVSSNRIIVKLKPSAAVERVDPAGSNLIGRPSLDAKLRKYRARGIRRVQNKSDFSPAKRVLSAKGKARGVDRIFVVDVDPTADFPALLAELQEDVEIEYAEPDFQARAFLIPDDIFFDFQWGLDNQGQSGGETGADIDAPEAWGLATGADSIIVAVLDSGIELTHQDLTGALVAGYDMVNNDAVPMDDDGHGTHVAGIIAAAANNGAGVAGVAHGVRLMPIKVLRKNGIGAYSDIIAGIIYAADHGARIINLSLGSPDQSQGLEDAVNYAHDRDCLLVAAMGNTADNTVMYPAAYANSMAVGYFDAGYEVESDSTYGDHIDLVAPGDAILSTVLGNEYGYKSGTSMAAPHVAGVAALLLSLNPALDPDELRTILNQTAIDDPSGGEGWYWRDTPGWDPYYGWGRLNAHRALSAVLPEPQVAVSDGFETGDLSHLPWQSSGDLPWEITASISHTGAYAVQAPAMLDNNQRAMIEVTVDCRADVLSFWLNTSTERLYDTLRFYIDGTLIKEWSGVLGWAKEAFPVTAGTHRLSWEYQKDNSTSAHEDTVFMDDIVIPVNLPPEITQGDLVEVDMDEDSQPRPFSLSLSATDPDGDLLSWSISANAAHGTASAGGTGITKNIYYSPVTDFNGLDSFEVEVNDGNGGQDRIVVQVRVAAVNDPPRISSTAVTTATQGQPYHYTVAGTDRDGDPISLTGAYPVWLTLVGMDGESALLVGTPPAEAVGSHTITLVVQDSAGATGSQRFNLLVSESGGGASSVEGDNIPQTVYFAPLGEGGTPVVLPGPPTVHDAHPGVVRIDDISGDNFSVRFQEWDYLDGTHAEEIIPYVVLAEGRFLMADGSIWEIGRFEMSNDGGQGFVKRVFTVPFTAAPAVFLAVQSDNDPEAVTVRLKKVSPSGFSAGLVEQENKKDGHLPETVGYLAVYSPSRSGVAELFGQQVPYLLQQRKVDGRFTQVGSYAVRFEEELSKDLEIRHKKETVEVLLLGDQLLAQAQTSRDRNPGSLRSLLPEHLTAMEWGTLSPVGSGWTMVPLARSYDDPVVVTWALAKGGENPVIPRVRNVGTDRFEMSLEHWGNGARLPKPETVVYLVAEAGSHLLAGLKVEAGKVQNGGLVRDNQWQAVEFETPFAAVPAVFNGISSTADVVPVTSRIRNVTETGFEISMQQVEAMGAEHDIEILSWIAVEKGSGLTEDGRQVSVFDAQVGNKAVVIPIVDRSDGRSPLVLGSVGSAFEEDPCVLRYKKGKVKVKLRVEEEKTADREKRHVEEEIFLFLAE